MSKSIIKRLRDCSWADTHSDRGIDMRMSLSHECRKLYLKACIPKSSTERFLIDLWRREKEKAKEYCARRDKVKICEMLEYDFIVRLEGHHIIIELEPETTHKSWEEMVTIESFSNSVLKSICECYAESCKEVSTSIAKGAFLYSSSSINSIPLPDTHPAYSAIWNWSYSETEFPKTINEFWSCDFTKLYVSKYEIDNSDMFGPGPPDLFSIGDEETDSYTLEVRRTAYRAHLTDTLARKSETEARTSQKDRELVLLGWMAAKGLKKGAKIEGGYSHKSLWNELVEYCPDQFPPTLGTDAIKKFFRDAKGICRFK